jgi:acetyl esterase/lipase
MRLPLFRLSLLLSTLVLAGCSGVYYRTINAGVDDERISWATYAPDRNLALDVHRPAAGTAAAPVVVFLHGGSWRHGDREGYRFVGQRLAEAGALVLVADYRKAPDHAFPDFMHDAAAAVAWARDNAARLGGDPDRLYLMGHSAGAHIAALLATDGQYLEAVGLRPKDLVGVIAVAGPYDFLPLTDPELKEVFGPEARWPDSQPVNFVDGDEPPFLLLHGDRDRIVWPRNSERLAARLAAAGSDARYVPVEGVGHIRILLGLRREDPTPAMVETLGFLGLD